MRTIVFSPLIDNELLEQVQKLANETYMLVEAGRDVSVPCAKLRELTGRSIFYRDIKAAWGTINHEVFGKGLLINYETVPTNLSDEEKLELIGHLCTGKGDECQQSWWVQCLKANTGDKRISDLIFSPKEYLGADAPAFELTPKEILDIALVNRLPTEEQRANALTALKIERANAPRPPLPPREAQR